MLILFANQPEETEEDRVAHENLKKCKASERSVVAMQAKYKVGTNTNTDTAPNTRLLKISSIHAYSM